MTVALILLIVLIVGGGILYIHDRLTRPAAEDGTEAEKEAQPEESECCGMHITCKKDSLVAGIDDEIVYYDDEELDRFKGRGADDYEEDEIEEFLEVLLTLDPVEIAGWVRSLVARDIILPTCVREQLLLILTESRNVMER
ncbi:MAG: phospholipase [Bacteroidales bacterium]|nr:phospholipase [Bacteroidales bacterium]MDE6801649.1 phospholipase [Muribaculaceae bacterium]MDE6831740.1 phospholipase [Muribaculaceae bacterium]